MPVPRLRPSLNPFAKGFGHYTILCNTCLCQVHWSYWSYWPWSTSLTSHTGHTGQTGQTGSGHTADTGHTSPLVNIHHSLQQ
eukprot:1161158-Pelagomonas_calceolata.AAC.4